MIHDSTRPQDEVFASDSAGDAEEQATSEGVQPMGPSAGEPTVAPAQNEQLEGLATELAAELAAANDRVIRAQAELENFRKRVYREMDEERKYAALPLLRDLLPVVDNLERAIQSAQQSPESQGLLEGVQLVFQQLGNVLRHHHCTAIDAKGKLFDPHLHEAIAQFPSPDFPRNTVMEVTQTGYLLHDRVVRASQVVVSSGTPA